MSDAIETTGTVWGVFAHRFALQTDGGKVLVDLGPKGSRDVTIAEGDRITVRGTRKPSEIKAEAVVTADGATHAVAWPDKEEKGQDGSRGDADPARVVGAVQGEGYAVTGTPTRKPKHWEIPASRDGQDVMLHVELDGWIRKVKAQAAASAGQ